MIGQGILEKFSKNTTVEKALEEMSAEELREILPLAMMYGSGDAERSIRQMVKAREGKRGRGRPKKFDDHFLIHATAEAAMTDRGPKTWRGHQNHFYQQRALTVLRQDKENLQNYLWLADVRDEVFNKVFKRTILAELGRLDDDWTIICYARELCEKKLATKKAVALIRQKRLDQAPQASAKALYYVIARAINEYAQTRQGMTDEIALDAVRSIYQMLLMETGSGE
jgi:hypothetical protein